MAVTSAIRKVYRSFKNGLRGAERTPIESAYFGRVGNAVSDMVNAGGRFISAPARAAGIGGGLGAGVAGLAILYVVWNYVLPMVM